jgi:membrane-associated phospholipid phosphatase
MTIKKVLTALAAGVALAVPGTASADVVTDWNKTLVDALLVARTSPQAGTRIGAIVQTSVFDAVNGVYQRYTQFHPELLPSAPSGASAPAAAASAAYTALVALFPAQKATFDAQLEAKLPLPFWQPTPTTPPTPECVAPLFRQFGTMTPWSMTSPSAFLPGPSPAFSSARYVQDFNEVKAIGSSATTPDLIDEAATARFWAGRFDTPVTMWNRVGRSLAVTRDVPLVYNARLFALLNVSLADAAIAVYNAKNVYEAWRPFTAIRNADVDGNDATIADPNWTALLTTPCHQEYPSGHSGLSAASTTVFAAFFGDDTTFTVSSDALISGGTRTYSSFSQAIDEIALARVAGGMHFRFACEASQEMAKGVADYAMAHEMLFRRGQH